MNMMKAILFTALLFDPATPQKSAAANQSVITTMCEVCESADGDGTSALLSDNIQSGCKTYTTPLNKCYNAQTLFPDDPSWSTFDIYDTLSMKSLKRTFYKSENGSCFNVIKSQELLETIMDRGYYYDNFSQQMDDDDYFVLPFDQCVGPFGAPRPWGKFTLVQNDDEKPSLIGEQEDDVAVQM